MTTSDVQQPSARQRRATPPRGPLPAEGAAVVATTGTIALLAIWFVLYALVLSGLEENHTQHVLYSQLREELAEETVPNGGAIRPGAPIAIVTSPTIGIHQVVVEGTSSADLTKGPGHLPNTPLPGQVGNSVILGRSAMFGAPFERIHDLRAGAIITVTTGQGTFGFRVLDVRGPGDPVPTVSELGTSSLTLETSAGTGWRSGWAPNEVIYADATLVTGTPQAAPAGRPSAVPAVDNALASDASDQVLFSLFVWLLALVLVALGLGYAYIRWTVWQMWFVGLPTLVALLWIVSNYVLMLLPNLV